MLIGFSGVVVVVVWTSGMEEMEGWFTEEMELLRDGVM